IEFGISKPKPRRNRINTIAKVNKTVPAKTPTIPVTLITRPMMISFFAITDLPLSPRKSLFAQSHVLVRQHADARRLIRLPRRRWRAAFAARRDPAPLAKNAAKKRPIPTRRWPVVKGGKMPAPTHGGAEDDVKITALLVAREEFLTH